MKFEITNKWCLQRAQLGWKLKTEEQRLEFLERYYADKLFSDKAFRRFIKRRWLFKKFLEKLSQKEEFDKLPSRVKKQIHCYL